LRHQLELLSARVSYMEQRVLRDPLKIKEKTQNIGKHWRVLVLHGLQLSQTFPARSVGEGWAMHPTSQMVWVMWHVMNRWKKVTHCPNGKGRWCRSGMLISKLVQLLWSLHNLV
jgi:hypothetical protein